MAEYIEKGMASYPDLIDIYTKYYSDWWGFWIQYTRSQDFRSNLSMGRRISNGMETTF